MYISYSLHRKQSCFKVSKCISYGVFIPKKVVKSSGLHISWGVHRTESCLKVAECIYDGVFIARKVVLKLWNVFIMECSSQEKLF